MSAESPVDCVTGESGRSGRFLPRVFAVYSYCAITFVSGIMLFVTLTLFLNGLYWAKDRAIHLDPDSAAHFRPDGAPIDNGRRTTYQQAWYDFTATSELGEAYVAEVLDDFWRLAGLGFAYQPWVGFSEPLFQGERVTVVSDPMGFPMRGGANPPHDSSLATVRVFAFGGSTTFGYGVSDADTWPSYLSAFLNKQAEEGGLKIRVEVSNYGRGYFDTSQETALALDLLKSGRGPELAIFMDGINLGPARDVNWFTDELTQAFWDAQQPSVDVAIRHLNETVLARLPYRRAAASVRRLLGIPGRQRTEGGRATLSETEDVDQLVHRFRMNRMIASMVLNRHGTATLFFLQPDPIFNYPPELYRQEVPERWWKQRKVRELFHELMRSEAGVIQLTNLFDEFGVGPNRKAIIDEIHYSPAFNSFLAEHVAARIDLASLVPSSKPAQSTGAQRAPADPPGARAMQGSSLKQSAPRAPN